MTDSGRYSRKEPVDIRKHNLVVGFGPYRAQIISVDLNRGWFKIEFSDGLNDDPRYAEVNATKLHFLPETRRPYWLPEVYMRSNLDLSDIVSLIEVKIYEPEPRFVNLGYDYYAVGSFFWSHDWLRDVKKAMNVPAELVDRLANSALFNQHGDLRLATFELLGFENMMRGFIVTKGE
jgi:hypothetical protein